MEADHRMSGIHRFQFHMSGAALKNIAYVTMFIDHFFAVIILNYIWMIAEDGVWDQGLTVVYRVGRAIGRISFILFAHQIVEGFLHTRSRSKFLLRLGLFALVSEIPFDLAFSDAVIDWNSQNIFCTLFLGIFTLTIWESFERYRGIIGYLMGYGAVVLGCAAAYFGNTDYRYMGVLLIFVFYRAHDKSLPVKMLLAGCVMLFGSSMREMYGLAAFLPIALYDGSKGSQPPKWFCYGFYPMHLLFLYGAARYIGVM